MKQISLFEVLPKTTKTQVLKPKIGNCEKTCKNYNYMFPDGTIDRYLSGGRRCVNMDFDKKQIIINNIWYCTCKNYEVKEKDGDT